jgi:Phage gp6-like head-tail connector protein
MSGPAWTTLATPAQFKDYLGLGADSSKDDLINRLLQSADSWIYKHLARPLGSLAYPFSFSYVTDGNNKDRMVLPYYPIQSISSITITSYGVGVQPQVIPIAPSYVTWGTQDGEDSRVVYLMSGYIFGRGRKNVTIAGVSGYVLPGTPSTPWIPDALVQAEIETVALMFKQKDRLGEQSKNLAGEVVSYFTRDLILPSTQFLLEPYRNRIPFGLATMGY